MMTIEDRESGLGQFDIVVCGRCGIGFTQPYPDEATTPLMYDSKSTSDFDEIRGTIVDRLKDFLARRLLKRLAAGQRIRSVLDYATGNGRFAIAATHVFPGAEVHALDYQAEPPPALRGVNAGIQYMEPRQLDNSRGRYDLIILRHVLEHSHIPVKLVESLGSHLSDNGMLFIEVPNRDSACARLFGSNWRGWYVPRHIFHYSRSSLAKVIELAGLRAEISRTEMPLMGNAIALATKLSQHSIAVKLAGVLLYPVQIAIEWLGGSSSCLAATCRRSSRVDVATQQPANQPNAEDSKGCHVRNTATTSAVADGTIRFRDRECM